MSAIYNVNTSETLFVKTEHTPEKKAGVTAHVFRIILK